MNLSAEVNKLRASNKEDFPCETDSNAYGVRKRLYA